MEDEDHSIAAKESHIKDWRKLQSEFIPIASIFISQSIAICN